MSEPDATPPETAVPEAALPRVTLPGVTLPGITLHVCVTCRADAERLPGVPVPGAVLHDRVVRLLAEREVPGLRLRGVECLAVCRDGCAASIAMPGKWSLLLGRLAPDKAADLLDFAGAYRASRTGTVMPSRRPASLADAMLGRLPPAPDGAPA